MPQLAASFTPVLFAADAGHSWRRTTLSIIFDRLIELIVMLVFAFVAALYLYAETPALSLAVIIGVLVLAAGLAIGLPLALGAAQLLSGLLYGVEPSSVAVLGGSALALSVVGLAASFLPAYRAVRIDPMEALRQE